MIFNIISGYLYDTSGGAATSHAGAVGFTAGGSLGVYAARQY